MPKKNAASPQESVTTYAVYSALTGAIVCGPYDKRADAKRECDRLNTEVIRGRTAPSEAHPSGQVLVQSGDACVMQAGIPMKYEVRSGERLIVVEG